MPTIEKFNKAFIETKILPQQKNLKGGEQRFFWDKYSPGFGLKLTPNKAVYIVQRRVVNDRGERTVRSVLCNYREKTVEKAREKAIESLYKMRQGADPVADKKADKTAAKTLNDALEDYIRQYDSKLRESTKKIYRGAFRRCFGEWLALPLTNIDENMVAERQIQLSNANGPRGKGEAHANQAMRVLRTIFNFAMLAYKDAKKQPLILTNPVCGLKARRLWNKSVSSEDILADDELATWYQAVIKLENTTVRDYMLLCLFTGLRRTEAARLTWDNVRLKGPKPILTIPAIDTKTNSEHQLPLPMFLVSLLESRSKVHLIDNKFVFPGEKPGSHMVEPKRAIAKVNEISGVNFSMHTLRRTFGTIAGKLDISHYKHKMLMNHSKKTAVTGAHYIKLTVDDLREPMEKIAAHVLAQTGMKMDDLRKTAARVS